MIFFFFLVLKAYAKGHKRERFSPITGSRYPVGKNHNSTNLEVETKDDSTWLKVPGPQKDNKGRYKNNRRNDHGKFAKRSPSPYSKEGKGKERQYPNSLYKGKNFDESFNANKAKQASSEQSGSKDKS